MLEAMEKARIWLFHQRGQTLYELARVGVQTILVWFIDNQINNIKNWQKQVSLSLQDFGMMKIWMKIF